jgi:hypothetical protein
MSRRAAPAAESVSIGQHAIFIENVSVPVEPRRVPIGDIKLDPANPRIQHEVSKRGKAGKITQDELGSLILEQSGVSELFKTIRDNGGLLDPIYVRPDGRVIEGNCRAASFLRLHRANPSDAKWQTIPTLLIPTITDRQVAILQGSFHVSGKNKWQAYEKAGHLHEMHTSLGMDPKAIGRALGMQEKVVTRSLAAYKVMKEKVLPKMKGAGLDKWSHVEEFFKNKELEEYRGKADNIDHFVELVVTKKVKHGADVRKLPRILKHSGATKVLKKHGVEKAISVVGRHDPTADSVVFRKMKDITSLLNSLPSPDLQRIRDEAKPKKLLEELAAAVRTVARAAGVKI